jgi:deltex-like protein
MPKGTMTAKLSKNFRCSGYEKFETIVITYNIPSGVQNGIKFSGTSRVCYLPNNKEGIEILGLLKTAFDRKLTFTIGTSVTTGLKNTVVWNGIHHKTRINGGATNYGYPDKTYFSRVKEELASKGVVKDNIKEDLETLAYQMLYS